MVGTERTLMNKILALANSFFRAMVRDRARAGSHQDFQHLAPSNSFANSFPKA